MSSTGIYKAEINILYIASHKLTQAFNPFDQLDAVSDYARSNGAEWGILFYFNESLTEQEVVAEWAKSTPLGIGSRFPTSLMYFARCCFDPPEHPTLVTAVGDDPRLESGSRAFFEHYGMQSCAVLPLYNKGRWIGVLMFAWTQPQTFDERSERIYTALQQQAAPVIDSVRLFEQTEKRALELEIAKGEIDILYEASSRLTIAVNPTQLLAAVSTYARDNGAICGQLFYLHHADEPNESAELMAEWVSGNSNSNPFAESTRDEPRWYTFGQLAMTPDQPILLTDPHLWLQQQQVMSVAVLPLGTRGRWIGFVMFGWGYKYRFTERDQRIYTLLQQQAAPVADSMRLFEQNRERAIRAEQLVKINAALSQVMTEVEFLAAIAPYAESKGARQIRLYYQEDRGGWKAIAVWVNGEAAPYDPTLHGVMILEENESAYGRLWHDDPDHVLFIEDVLNDARIAESERQNMAQQAQALATIPLFSSGRYHGVMHLLWDAAHLFSDEEKYIYEALMRTFSAVIATRREFLAKEEARRETERRARDLAALEERTRLARELHDSVSQALYGIGLGARTAKALMTRDPSRLQEPLDYVLSLAEAGLTEMRALIFELRPESLEQEGLISVLSKQAASLETRHGIKVQTSFGEEPALSMGVKESVYRIAREALHNTVKHAQASEVKLTLLREAGGYRLEIVDNGGGFDTQRDFRGHLGLKSMEERTRSLGGVLSIESAPGVGTRIEVWIPG
ncbi:MAG: GAF domain-containing sensor histidine kinase [Anaerolineae bacterium]|jgi:signal transduction histidine kinase|nr:GAF domain-containing sensor histidine kinase [Anaerolineae bacterium]